MISLNLNVLSEDQLLVLASSLMIIMEGMPIYSHIRHEYQESVEEIQRLYLLKAGEPFKPKFHKMPEPKIQLSQTEIVEKYYN